MCSMISAQRDELRWLADNLEEHDSHMDEYVQAMRSAADTIWELRNKLCDMVDARERARVLEADNAKLREYVSMLAKATVYDPCEWCQHDGDGTCGVETEPMCDGCRLYEEMCKLGVEVTR